MSAWAGFYTEQKKFWLGVNGSMLTQTHNEHQFSSKEFFMSCLSIFDGNIGGPLFIVITYDNVSFFVLETKSTDQKKLIIICRYGDYGTSFAGTYTCV